MTVRHRMLRIRVTEDEYTQLSTTFPRGDLSKAVRALLLSRGSPQSDWTGWYRPPCRRCDTGHSVMLEWNFCPGCGSPLLPACRLQDARKFGYTTNTGARK